MCTPFELFIQGKGMFRFAIGLAIALCSTLALAENIAPLAVGGKEVRIAVQDGYVQASEKTPALFATSAAALPPALRLVEALLAESDIKRMLIGQSMSQPYLQVQVMRDAEAVNFSEEEWRALQPSMAQQLGATNLDPVTQAMQESMSERMGKAAGGSVEIKFGEVGKPKVYSLAGDVIRYVIRLPIKASMNGKEVSTVLECAGAVLVLNGKLLMFNTYRPQPDENFAKLRAFLDSAVERAQALNATPASGKGS